MKLLLVVGALLLPTLIGVALIAAIRLWRRWEDRDRDDDPLPMGRPIERIAADLRRLNHQRGHLRQQVPGPGRGVQSRALAAAYVDVLTEACRVLEVAPPRASGAGQAASAEIERVEAELLSCGLDVGRVD